MANEMEIAISANEARETQQKPEGENNTREDAIKMEGDALLEAEQGETNEASREIAKKYIETIPSQDRVIQTAQDVKILLYCLKNSYIGGDMTLTVDKLGNLPGPIQEAFMQGKTAGEVAPLARAFANDVIKGSEQTDKVRQIAQSTLPETVRSAVLKIVLEEGDRSTKGAFLELANRMEADPSSSDLSVIIHGVRNDQKYVSRDADNVRREALQQFLQGVYPDIMSGKEVSLLKETWDLNKDATPDEMNENIQKLLIRYKEVLGDNPFSEETSERLEGAMNFSDMADKFADGSLEADVSIFSAFDEELKQSILHAISSGNKIDK